MENPGKYFKILEFEENNKTVYFMQTTHEIHFFLPRKIAGPSNLSKLLGFKTSYDYHAFLIKNFNGKLYKNYCIIYTQYNDAHNSLDWHESQLLGLLLLK